MDNTKDSSRVWGGGACCDSNRLGHKDPFSSLQSLLAWIQRETVPVRQLVIVDLLSVCCIRQVSF